MLRHIACTALTIFLASFEASAADRLKVAVGQRGQWESAIPELGAEHGIFAKHGLQLEVFYTQGTGETQQAVISGSADLGSGLNIFGVLATASKGAPIRILGSTMTGVRDLFWYARADAKFASMRDAAGVRAGFSTVGSSFQTGVLAFERLYGVKYQLMQTGGIMTTYTQVQTGQVDVGFSAVPVLLDQEAEGKIKIVGRGGELAQFDRQTFRILAVNAGVLSSKADAIARFMTAYKEAITWLYTDPVALKAYAAHAGVSEAAAKRVRDEFTPQQAIAPDEIKGVANILQEAKSMKMVADGFDRAALGALLAPGLVALEP